MNQRFLTNFSIITIKYLELQNLYTMGNESFLRSQIFLQANRSQSNFQNYLFYTQTQVGVNYQFKTLIEFQQEIFFRHKLSHKYLAFSIQFKDQQGDSIVKLQLSDKPCKWKIIPCFQYQTKISQKVKFNEDIYLATQFSTGKLGYISVGQQQKINRLQTNLSLNIKTKFVLSAYFQQQKQQKGYTYGQAVWIKHVQSNKFATVYKPQEKNIPVFQSIDMQDDLQSINGLWLIESTKTQNGGNLSYNEPFYLKNLCTYKYLSFSKQFKMINNEKQYNIILLDKPIQQSKFIFDSLKSDETKIKKSSYLKLKHYISNLYIGTRQYAKTQSILHNNILTFIQFEDQDLYDFIELKSDQQVAIRFIFSVKRQINYINNILSIKTNEINRKMILQFEDLYENIIGQFNKLNNTNLLQQVQDELGPSIIIFCNQIRSIRDRMRRYEQNNPLYKLLKYIYQILILIIKNYERNQFISYEYIIYFIDDIFNDIGAQQLLSQIFKNNYSLLCKISNDMKQVNNDMNIINKIFDRIINREVKQKNNIYWNKIIKIFDLIQILLLYHEKPIDINQRLISTQLFNNNKFDKIFFEIKVFNQRIRMMHPQLNKWIQIQQIIDNKLILILQGIFNLLSKLCQNRNFISKQYINKYLNYKNIDAVEIIISYLNIPLSNNLSNNLFSLVTNCYIDSSPRINRNKPLAIINFTFQDNRQKKSKSDQQSDLRQKLLDKQNITKQDNNNYLLMISNLVEGMITSQPTLTQLQLDLYKQQLNQKMKDALWSKQLLRSICILIRLQSYKTKQMQNIQKMISQQILKDKMNRQIIVSIMQILQQYNLYECQLQLKKVTAYLKYKFNKKLQIPINNKDIRYCLQNNNIPIQMNKKQGQILIINEQQYRYQKQFNQYAKLLKQLNPKNQLKKGLLQKFIKGKQYKFNILSELFKAILNFYYPKLRIVHLLTRSIILTQDQISNFDSLFKLYKKIKYLSTITQHWLSSNRLILSDSRQYCYVLLQLTNYLFQDYVLDSQKDKRFRKSSKININRQLLIRNLSVHEVVLQILNSNFYLLQYKNKNEIRQNIRQVFIISFQFLYYFCLNCQQNIQLIIKKFQVLQRFRDLSQFGQTRLLILLFKSSSNLIKQVKLSTIQKYVSKILRTQLNSIKQNQCQYNPQYLQVLNIICYVDGIVYKKNLQLIFKVIQKDMIIRRLLFIQKGRSILNLNPQNIRQDIIQVPIIYHNKLIKLFSTLLRYLQSSGTFIKHKIKQIINIQQLLKILSLPDIYTHRGIIPQMYFILKKQYKSDNISNIYQSKQLGVYLTYLINVFIFRKQRQIYPSIDRQYLYQPYIQQYKQQLRYDFANQRDYYTSIIQPFINRLLLLFEKYSNKNNNKNYQKLIFLNQNIISTQLPQDHLLKHQLNGIDLIQLKWRNFVDDDQQNSSQQKFAKTTVLQILRNNQTYRLIQQQKQIFFKAIKQYQQDYFNIMGILIQMASNQNQNTENQRNFFHQLIQNLADYLVWSIKQQNSKKGWQGQQLVSTLIGYVIRQGFQFNDRTSRKTFYEILRIIVFLLENEQDSRLLKQMYKIFTNNSSCFRFFNCLRQSLSQISNRIFGQKSHQHINQALNDLYVCGEQRKCDLDRQSLKLLTLLCKYLPFTDFLRSQPYTVSTDFLDKIYNSFYFLVKRNNQNGLTINVSIVSISQQILNCVLSMLNGCNQANQNYIIDNKFPQIVSQALKMDSIHLTSNRGELAKRDRLIEQVCQFYQSNGLNVQPLINEKIKLIDFHHLYLLNRFKYSLLRLIIQTTIANDRGLSKIRILIPLQLLKINLIWIYEDFKKQNIQYTQQNILRSRQNWLDIIKKQQKLNSIFLMIGFYYYQLIQYHQIQQKQNNQQQGQFSMSQQKQKQKLIKKFFSSISDKQKNIQKVKTLQKQPFSQQMKLFYNKYYQAYQFFSNKAVTIQANIYDHLIRLYFPKIPLCNKLTQKMQQKLINQADRISHQQKIKSLMSFQKQTYQFLQGQQDYFIQMNKKSMIIGKTVQLVKHQDRMYFFIWCMSVIIVLCYLIDDMAAPTNIFSQQFASYFIPNSLIALIILILSLVNLCCGLLLLTNMILRKIPFLLRLYQYKYNQQLQQQGQMSDNIIVYQIKNVMSASILDAYLILFSILTIFHPMFAGFLLVYIIKLIELGKTIVQAIQQTAFNLIITASLLIVFNYIFSILIYCASFTDDIGYGTTCKTLYTCLLMLLDQTLKAGGGFLATNRSDFTNMVLNFKVLAEIMYILFAQKVIFEIFSGTIIDKFGQLRQKGDSTQQDQQSNCFICGQQRFQIDFQLQGFQKHIQQTHNKLNYVYYMFYLRRKSKIQYGIQQNYVWQNHIKQKYDFVPDGTSIQKQIKQRQSNDENEEDYIQQYQKFYQKKLVQFKKLHTKVENMSSQLKQQNIAL